MKNTTDSSTDKGRSNKKSKLTKEKSWLRKVFHLTGSTGKKKKAVDSDEIMKTVEVSVDDVIKKGAAGETATEVADGGEEKKATSASQRDGFWEPDNPDSHVVIRDSSERFSGETPFGEDGDKKKTPPLSSSNHSKPAVRFNDDDDKQSPQDLLQSWSDGLDLNNKATSKTKRNRNIVIDEQIVDDASDVSMESSEYPDISNDEVPDIHENDYVQLNEKSTTERKSILKNLRQIQSFKLSEDDVPAPATPFPTMSEHNMKQLNESYITNVPEIKQMNLHRGGTVVKTDAVGSVQFGVPPETIKDSMLAGIEVPEFYIIPMERFSRELGDSLGINFAEFEFPAYFNYFVKRRSCVLIVDDAEAEKSLRRVFEETLWGPEMFRKDVGRKKIKKYNKDDFDEDYDPVNIPDFYNELKYFRTLPGADEEFKLEELLQFVKFKGNKENEVKDRPFGKPDICDNDVENKEQNVTDCDDLLYSDIIALSDMCVLYPKDANRDSDNYLLRERVEIFKVPGNTGYIIHDIDEDNIIVGKAVLGGFVDAKVTKTVTGFNSTPKNGLPPLATNFKPPIFGLTVLGNSHGFDAKGSTSGYVLWVNGRGIMIDPPPYSSSTLLREGINPSLIIGIILTHCHADHDAGAFMKILTGSQVVIISTPTIYNSFITKYSALSKLPPALLHFSHRRIDAIIGQPMRFHGAIFHFCYALHSIPCICFRVEMGGRSMVFTGDTLYDPPLLEKLAKDGIMSKERVKRLCNWSTQPCDIILHEAGVPPIHTPINILKELDDEIKQRMYIVHTASVPEGCGLKLAPPGTAATLQLDPIVKYEQNYLTASCDAWFQLNLLSNVPFVTDLPYNSTMDLLEVVRVDFFEKGAIVVPQSCRKDLLCVIWEGTCYERPVGSNTIEGCGYDDDDVFWSAGDWSGPSTLQPEKKFSGESERARTHDIVALSSFGVKAIFVEKVHYKRILKKSILYRKFLHLYSRDDDDDWSTSDGLSNLDKTQAEIHEKAMREFNLMDLLSKNTSLRNLKPFYRRHLECLAEKRLAVKMPGELLWGVNKSVESAFLIVSGEVLYKTYTLGSEKREVERSARGSLFSTDSQVAADCRRVLLEMGGDGSASTKSEDRPKMSESSQQSDINLDSGSRVLLTKGNSFYVHTDTRQRERHLVATRKNNGLVLGQSNFICDIASMLSTLLHDDDTMSLRSNQSSLRTRLSWCDSTNPSAAVAGKNGCVVCVFPKTDLLELLDSYPGLLFSMSGGPVIV